MPTLPLHQGCAATHAMKSWASCPSGTPPALELPICSPTEAPGPGTSPWRTRRCGSIPPVIAAGQAAVSRASPPLCLRWRPRPSRYSSTWARRDRRTCASASWITTLALRPVISQRAKAPPTWSIWPWASRIQRRSPTGRPKLCSPGAIPTEGELAMPVSTIAASAVPMKKLESPKRPHCEKRVWTATALMPQLSGNPPSRRRPRGTRAASRNAGRSHARPPLRGAAAPGPRPRPACAHRPRPRRAGGRTRP